MPVYSEAESVQLICEKLRPFAQDIEVLVVNDGNINNGVYSAVEALKKFEFIKVIHLARNFGQHVAIAAGMKNATGDYVLSMDADLQYDPIECLEMAREAIRKELPVLLSVHKKSSHPLLTRIASKIYYKFASRFLGLPYPTGLGSAFVVSREVCSGLLSMGDRYRMTIPMVFWLYGDIAYHQITHFTRKTGRSGYTFRKKVRHALNGATSFSTGPLTLVLVLGFIFATISFVVGLGFLIVQVVAGSRFLEGWLSTILVSLFSSGLVLLCIGIVGIYVGRIFDNTSNRPLYFVRKKANSPIKLFEE